MNQISAWRLAFLVVVMLLREKSIAGAGRYGDLGVPR